MVPIMLFQAAALVVIRVAAAVVEYIEEFASLITVLLVPVCDPMYEYPIESMVPAPMEN
jgi:hypothetical protein